MDRIDTETKVLGLVGDPVSESLSPRLHNRVIEKSGLNYRYFAFPVRKGGLKQAIHGARELGVKGLNVTVPHKKEAAELMDLLSPSATAMGAINTVIFTDDGKLKGDNTDWRGFTESLKLHGFTPEGKSCLVFGAGGGAAGVVFGLVREGAERIDLVNRTEAKAGKLARRMEGISPGVKLEVRPISGYDLGKRIENSELVVNATSVGMGSTEGQSIWDDSSNFHSEQIVYDLVYQSLPTEFLELAAAAGAETIDGLAMLILQGLGSLELWTGRDFTSSRMVDELREYLGGDGSRE